MTLETGQLHSRPQPHPWRKQQLLLATFGVASTLALGACSPSRTDMTSSASASEPAARKQARAAYRQNPQPKQAYRITMTIENAPGPFARMLGLAQFDVINPECLPPPDDNNGHLWPVPTEGVEISLQKVAKNTYSGVVYADQMLDEDYYERGVCEWELIQVQVQLMATGAKDETKFIPSLDSEELFAGKPQKVYFWKERYPRASVENYPDFGEIDRSKFRPEMRDEELFTVTLSASKEAP
jgi:hypothetical protein